MASRYRVRETCSLRRMQSLIVSAFFSQCRVDEGNGLEVHALVQIQVRSPMIPQQARYTVAKQRRMDVNRLWV